MAFDVNHLKQQYDAHAKQYSLPSFEKLNDEFELEKITQETLAPLRAIRKTMLDKIMNTLSFLEMLLNPVNAPRVYLPYIKVMSIEERKAIEKSYSTLGRLSLQSLPLEIDYSEKAEALMIKDIYGIWAELKPSLRELLKKIASPASASARREHSYFG